MILGFGIGIGTNIFIGNLISNIEQDLINRTINSRPHIEISSTNSSEYLENYKEIIDILDNTSEVKIHLKVLQGRAFIVNYQSDKPEDIIVRGFNSINKANQIYDFYNDKYEGQPITEPHHVIIGKSLAEKLDLSIGDPLNVSISPVAPIGRILEVRGIYDLGSAALNEIWLIGSNVMAGFVLYSVDKVSTLLVQLKDHMQAEEVAEELKQKISDGDVQITHWMDEEEALLNSLQAQSISTKIVQFFILLSVAIAIGSVLSITVVHKQRQIGILKAMGMSDEESAKVFLFQGAVLGVLGAGFGCLFGLTMILFFNLFAGDDVVTIVINPGFTLLSMVIGISAAVIAAYIPSRTSRRLEVIEIIQRN